MDLSPLWLSVQLAAWTSAILFALGLPLAAWLAGRRSPWKLLVEAAVSLPIVLPPTVVGFYLLWALGPRSVPGRLYDAATGSTLPFTFGGILVGSVIYNLPFAVRPFAAALRGVDRRLVEASWCLGVSRLETFRRITLPLAWRGILAGLILAFAHTLGEFGIVLMLGGNIPGVTRTLSVAIYDDVQALDYASAGTTSMILLGFSLAVLCALNALERRRGEA